MREWIADDKGEQKNRKIYAFVSVCLNHHCVSASGSFWKDFSKTLLSHLYFSVWTVRTRDQIFEREASFGRERSASVFLRVSHMDIDRQTDRQLEGRMRVIAVLRWNDSVVLLSFSAWLKDFVTLTSSDSTDIQIKLQPESTTTPLHSPGPQMPVPASCLVCLGLSACLISLSPPALSPSAGDSSLSSVSVNRLLCLTNADNRLQKAEHSSV